MLLLFYLRMLKENVVSTNRLMNFGLLTLFIYIASCGPAQYEFVKPAKDTNRTGTPLEVNPDQNPQTLPIEANLPPTARVEAIDNGKSVTRVKVGTRVIIRPSLDTYDVDDIGKSTCVNPGIVKAQFKYDATGADRSRPNNICDSLNVEHQFTVPGDYPIEMIVTSNENETAFAKMILTVEADTPAQGGFTIKADPMVAGVGQKIVFTGTCNATGATTITWDFKDGTKAEGRQVPKKFDRTGQFQVDAVCTDSTGKTWTASVTIVVLPKAIFDDGVEDPIPDPTPTPTPPPTQDPGKKPTPAPTVTPKPPVPTITPKPTPTPCYCRNQRRW
jgi:hypothetical protein